MFLSIITLLFVVSPFNLVASSTCTTSNAISWAESGSTTGGTTNGSSGSSDSSSSNPCSEYADDPTALQACYEMQSQGECNAVGGSACDGEDYSDYDDYEDLILRKRDTLSCYSDETCYEYTDGSLFCLNEVTGDYSDDVGGFGNVYTGEYTLPDGSQTTVEGAAATSSSTISSGNSATDTQATSRAAAATSSPSSSGSRPVGATGAATGTATSTSSTSAAAPTVNSGVGKVKPGSAMGVLGLIVALI
ncbi:hypothetical protein BOTCAL_0122g00210 [Botryotinia calthae]|uniref:Ig-like domain-containing protein n=1 Tax=Botryotinia calthae TaxID=38488 RepID=A0A4Y8D6R7_9HELO|nr:hypothetical protein BOTCAL_0122g00210 [Botryotinia calthae]